MSDRDVTGVQIASDTEVREAAREFADTLLATLAFQKYDAAGDRVNADKSAQKAIQAFQQRQQDFQTRDASNPITNEERAELEDLRSVFMAMPVVMEYFQAQSEAVVICQNAGDLLSEKIGMSFASSACTGGCCG